MVYPAADTVSIPVAQERIVLINETISLSQEFTHKDDSVHTRSYLARPSVMNQPAVTPSGVLHLFHSPAAPQMLFSAAPSIPVSVDASPYIPSATIPHLPSPEGVGVRFTLQSEGLTISQFASLCSQVVKMDEGSTSFEAHLQQFEEATKKKYEEKVRQLGKYYEEERALTNERISWLEKVKKMNEKKMKEMEKTSEEKLEKIKKESEEKIEEMQMEYADQWVEDEEVPNIWAPEGGEDSNIWELNDDEVPWTWEREEEGEVPWRRRQEGGDVWWEEDDGWWEVGEGGQWMWRRWDEVEDDPFPPLYGKYLAPGTFQM